MKRFICGLFATIGLLCVLFSGPISGLGELAQEGEIYCAIRHYLGPVGIVAGHEESVNVRHQLDASVKLRDGKPLTDMSLNLIEKFALRKVLDKAQGTDIEKLLKAYNVI